MAVVATESTAVLIIDSKFLFTVSVLHVFYIKLVNWISYLVCTLSNAYVILKT